MDASGVWRNLARRFIDLDPHRRLALRWKRLRALGSGWPDWKIAGADTRSEQEFLKLSAECGRLILPVASIVSDPEKYWLAELSASALRKLYKYSEQSDGSETRARIEQICELAALHCEIYIPIVEASWERVQALYRREQSDFYEDRKRQLDEI